MAISADGERWFLLNASPEIRWQIESFPALHPRAPRHSPIAGILLINGDLDHCLGLLSLRESHPLVLYASDAVRRGFTESNVLYRTLQRFEGQITWRRLAPGQTTELPGGLIVQGVAAPGKPPVHLEGLHDFDPGENLGLLIHDIASGKRLAYFSAAAGITPAMYSAFGQADCLFFDGTFWSSDELIALDLGSKRAEEMAHLPVGGASGSLAALAGIPAGRKIYIHINNTNPMLIHGSPERRKAEALGWEIARDGMELVL